MSQTLDVLLHGTGSWRRQHFGLRLNESLLEIYVKPDSRVADCHQGILDVRMKEMVEKLPEINKVFDGAQLEMAGSVLNRTKVSLY